MHASQFEHVQCFIIHISKVTDLWHKFHNIPTPAICNATESSAGCDRETEEEVDQRKQMATKVTIKLSCSVILFSVIKINILLCMYMHLYIEDNIKTTTIFYNH